MPAAVRRMATRSPGRICSSMKRRRAARTRGMLSNDRFKSSTTMAIVRRTPSRVGGANGGLAAAAAAALSPGMRGAAPAGTYWKAEIVCGRLSWSTSKSAASRLVTCRPFWSVTVASIWTSSTEMRSGEGLRIGSAGAGCCSAPGAVEPMTIRPQTAAAAAVRRERIDITAGAESTAEGGGTAEASGTVERAASAQFFVEVRLIEADRGGKITFFLTRGGAVR